MKKLMLRFRDEYTGIIIYQLIAISTSVDKLKAKAIEHAGNSVYDEVWNNDILSLSDCTYTISNEEPL